MSAMSPPVSDPYPHLPATPSAASQARDGTRERGASGARERRVRLWRSAGGVCREERQARPPHGGGRGGRHTRGRPSGRVRWTGAVWLRDRQGKGEGEGGEEEVILCLTFVNGYACVTLYETVCESSV